MIIVVPDADALYAAFAGALRAAYGKLPASSDDERAAVDDELEHAADLVVGR